MSDFALIFEKSRAGRRCSRPPVPPTETPVLISAGHTRRTPLRLPEIAEVDLVRHYMGLSRRAYGVDNGFYPLGSCTMKYNPRVNETAASDRDLTGVHPLQDVMDSQGCLEMYETAGNLLKEITGMDAFTLQPAAGAHGEYTGLSLIRAYHAKRGDTSRKTVLVPDAAHGTNPASAAMNGFTIKNIPSNAEGGVDIAALREAVGDDTAALMLTNPNTLGLFERNIKEIAEIVHGAGGLLYYDGANLNAIMGICRPGDMGFDVVHLNLHKTFSTPHGGGGPGSGPVGCKKALEPFLPVPVLADEDGFLYWDYDRPDSIGKVSGFYGNFLVIVKALTYMLTLGGDGLRDASQNALLNANYMLSKLQKYSDLKYSVPCMHEFVLSLEGIKKRTGASALDVAKAMPAYGIHPPTMYFPLIVHEALMIEPTETESVETLDAATAAIEDIFARAETDAEGLHSEPQGLPIKRPDEVAAARHPVVKYDFSGNEEITNG